MKSPIKVKLVKNSSALVDSDYRIAQITGAITIWTQGGIESRLRVGDFISEAQAEKLNKTYTVTITLK